MPMNLVALRLLNQQLCAPQLSDPAELVDYMGAMQAQEYRAMRWAVAMRTREPSHQAFKAAFDAGRIIRLHLMRGTWQLVSARDYRPMLALLAPKAIAVTKGWMSSNRISITEREQAQVGDILARTAALRRSATKEDFKQALVERGMAGQVEHLSFHIRLAELNGLLCSGDLLPMKPTYALAADKVTASATMERDEALAYVARKYFRSHQPATLEDFAWWSGLNIGDCRNAIALLADYLHQVSHNGRTFYLTDDCRTRGFRKGRYLLLPPYDEYLIGYKSRDIVLPIEHRHHAHDNKGIFRPVVARDGRIVGNWSPWADDCKVAFFEESPGAEGIATACNAYLRYRNMAK